MRIVLLTTPARTRKINYVLPSGIIALAAYLEQHGHDVRVVDAALLRQPYEQLVRRVAEFEPHLIGVGGIITAYAYIIGLTRAIKRALPEVPVVVGGQVAVNNVKNCFEHMAIDYVVHGYGEFALEKLARHVAGTLPLKLIPGISYVQDGRIVTTPGREFFRHLDDMPLPAYHLVDMDHYTRIMDDMRANPPRHNGKIIDDARTLSVYGTLGCTDRCTFCIHEQEFVGIKFASNDNLIRHLKFLNEDYGIRIFNMGEEMFISKFSRAKEFNDLMKEHLPDCYWTASTRADFVTPELIAELKTGNCLGLGWGYETGSQKMLDLMKKRMTVGVNARAYKLTQETELFLASTLLVGNIGETDGTIRETIANVHETGLYPVSVFIAAAYPGGRTWDWAVERGVIEDTHRYLLSVSDKDARELNINLTPHPDFILKAWQTLVQFAVEMNGRRKDPNHPLKPNLKWGRRHFAKMVWRDIYRRFVLPPAVRLYFIYYKMTRAVYKTKKDRKFLYRVDEKGALLPDNLIVGAPQGFVREDKLTRLAQAPRAYMELTQVSAAVERTGDASPQRIAANP